MARRSAHACDRRHHRQGRVDEAGGREGGVGDEHKLSRRCLQSLALKPSEKWRRGVLMLRDPARRASVKSAAFDPTPRPAISIRWASEIGDPGSRGDDREGF